MTSHLTAISRLDASDHRQMHTLLRAHFEGVSHEQFLADLSQKNWAILLRSADGTLVGFTTILSFDRIFDGQRFTIIYSGDTIVARDAWGTASLPRAWIAAVNQIRTHHAGDNCYWLLITSGFRTYRFLPVFWQTFYPRFDQPTPPKLRQLMDALAAEQFGDAYDAQRGVVTFAHPQILRPALAGIPEERLVDPHVAFFAARNPGHAAGDELVSLCELSAANLTPAGRRMVRER